MKAGFERIDVGFKRIDDRFERMQRTMFLAAISIIVALISAPHL